MAKAWRIDSGRHGHYIRAGKPTDPLGGDVVAAVFDLHHAQLIAQAPAMKDLLKQASGPMGLSLEDFQRWRVKVLDLVAQIHAPHPEDNPQ